MQLHDSTQGRRVERILRQVESLPTLPAVATRLRSLIAGERAHPDQIIDIVECDPVLTATVLSMCRKSDMGAQDEVVSVDRAISLLGIDAIRNAALSVQVINVFEDQQDKDDADRDLLRFDRAGFWRHSLAVAIAARMIAKALSGDDAIAPQEAYVCGLLHDIGKIALDDVMPKSFARVVELTDLNRGNIAEYERNIVGLDHHTVGKRLAEHWRLGHRLQDCIWLHGSSFDTLPRLDHRRLIGLITLADALVREQDIGYSGNHQQKQSIEELCRCIAVDPRVAHEVAQRLTDEIESRAALLGLDDNPTREAFLESMQLANQMLGEMSSSYQSQSRMSAKQLQILDAISAFHAGSSPGRSVQDVINQVAANAANVLGAGFYAMVYQHASTAHDENGWLICQYGEHARPLRSELVEAPPHGPNLRELDPREPAVMSLMSIVPWVADYLVDAPDLREVRLLPLSCGWGTAAVLLHDRDQIPRWQQLAPLASTWGTAIAAASQHDGARRLGEELAEANLALAETQDRLLQNESMARVGEMAAGAAHEMNNPLAVISGRSQLLCKTLPRDTREHKAAQTIVDQSHRLSDLITSLKLFAQPTSPQRMAVNPSELLQDAIDRVQSGLSADEKRVLLNVTVTDDPAPVYLDPLQVGRAIDELVLNAFQSEPRSSITVSAQVNDACDELVIQVTDDGHGMDAHTLAHAADPFFSAKRAGRRVGMGLARAQQLAAAHNGSVELRSAIDAGTTATLTIKLDTASPVTDTTSREGSRQEELRHTGQSV